MDSTRSLSRLLGPTGINPPSSMTRFLLLFLLATHVSVADQTSHREVAAELLELAGGEDSIQLGANAMIEALTGTWAAQGVPEGLIPLFIEQLKEWIAQDFVWTEMEAEILDLYMTEFSESELKDIIAFYLTPTGKKSLERMPQILAASMQIGQKYAASKEIFLQQRLEKVAMEYQASRSGETADGESTVPKKNP